MNRTRGKPEKTPPAIVVRPSSSGDPNSNEVWIRMAGFLSVRAPNTRRTYTSIFKEWCEFLGAPFGTSEAAARVLAATDLHAQAYRAWLETRPGEKPRLKVTESSVRSVQKRTGPSARRDGVQSTISNATIWKKFAALRRMYRMLQAADLGLRVNPFDVDRNPPPPKESGRKRPTEMVPFEQVLRVLESPLATNGKGVRDRAILAALFGGGLRRSEVTSIRVGDVLHSSNGNLFLRLRATKSRKDFDQAIPDWAAKAVLELFEQRKREKALPGDFLFVSYRGRGGSIPTSNPVSSDGVYKLFKHYCARAGVRAFATPHSARATAITKLLSDGVPHRLVQEFSRHASVQMVEVYDKRRIGVDENPGLRLNYRKGKN